MLYISPSKLIKTTPVQRSCQDNGQSSTHARTHTHLYVQLCLTFIATISRWKNIPKQTPATDLAEGSHVCDMWLPLPCLCLLASFSADAGSNSKDGQIFGDKNSACFSAQETVSVFFSLGWCGGVGGGITSSIDETTDSIPHRMHHEGDAFLFREPLKTRSMYYNTL